MCCAKHTTRHNTIRHTLTFLLICQLFAYNLGKIQLSLIEEKLLHYSLGKLQLTDDEKFFVLFCALLRRLDTLHNA